MKHKNNLDKRLISNILYQMGYQAFTAVYPLLTTPIISRAFGAEGLGVYSYSYSVVYYISLFGALGIHTYGGRNSAILRDDRNKLSENFCSLYCIQFFCSLLCILVYILYSLCVHNISFTVNILQGTYLLVALFDISWLLSGLEKYQVLVIRNCFIKLASLALIYFFVKSENDLNKYILIINLTSALGQISVWPTVRKYISLQKVSFIDIKKHIVPVVKLFFPVLAINANSMIDKLVLGNFISMSAVGFYENSDKIIKIPISVANAACAVLVQRAAYNVAKGKKNENNRNVYVALKYNYLFILPIISGLCVIIPDVVPWFLGEEFSSCIYYIRLLSPAIFLIITNNILRLQYFMANNRDNEYIISIILSVIINLILNLLTVSKFQINGIIMGTICGELVSVCYLIYKSYTEIPYILLLKDIIFFSIGAVFMGLVVYNIELYNFSGIIKNLVQILIGCSVYLVYLFLFYILKKIKKDTI